MKAWAASITRNGSSAIVVDRAVGILAGILDDAVEHRALAVNPARRFKRREKPKKSPKRHAYLTADDVCRLAEESGRHADLVLILAFTGLRWGEAAALTVADVEFLKRRITVHRNALSPPSHGAQTPDARVSTTVRAARESESPLDRGNEHVEVGAVLGRQRFVRDISPKGGNFEPGCGELVGCFGGIAAGALFFGGGGGGGVVGRTPRCAPSKHAKA